MSVNLSGKGQERRTAQREPIRRSVVFAGVRGEGLLRQGLAADISASGLLILTTQPDLVGRHLEIELHPDGAPVPGAVIMVRGEVVWTRPHKVPGEYAMGVRFLQSFPATDVTGAGHRPATRDESAAMAASIQRRLASMEPAVRIEISEGARRMGAASGMEGPAVEGRSRRRSYRWLWLLLLCLGFSAIISGATIVTLWRLGFYKTEKKSSVRAVSVPKDEKSDDGKVSEAAPAPSKVSERIDVIRESGPAYYLNRGSLFLVQGRYPAAAQAFQSVQSKAGTKPVERYVAELGEAQALASDGKTSEALGVLERPWPETDEIPSQWQALRAEFVSMLNASPEAPESRAPLENAFAFAPAASPGERATDDAPDGDVTPDAPAEAPVKPESDNSIRIEIDTSRHLLNVLENNSIKAVYPVGLGAQGKTPEGVFTIVNKIENPEWYNQGNPVPAGSPENELGSRWIGLGDKEGPTPLGIHATDDLASIGGNKSRGCIRMRPADVEELFKWVSVGTPVRIRSL